MRQVRLHYVKIAALLCALCAGVGAQAQTGAAPAEQPPVKGFTPPAEPVKGFIPPNAASGTVIDSIAVVVNDEVITRNELAGRIKSITTRIKEQNGAMPPETDLQRQVLELMIVERAQMQLAKEMGMRVDDRQLDRAISGIAAQNKLSVQEFRNQIEKGGVTFASFRDGIREELMMERLREHEVDNKVLVTETEVDSFIASEDAAAKEQVDMKLAQIMIRIPDNASAEQIAARRARVDDVSRQLRTGADFAKLAATYSDAGDALKGGELGWQNPNRLPPVFAQALGELKPGQATLPIKTPTGFFILKMSEKRSVAEGKEQALVQQSRARHILIKVNPTMTANDAKRKLLDIKERLVRRTGAPVLG